MRRLDRAPKRGIHHMADPIADGSAAKWHPASPIPRHPERRVGPKLRRANPEVVIQPLRDFVVLVQFRQIRYLRIHLGKRVGPRMNRMHLPDGSGPDPFANAPDSIARMPLIS